MLVRIPFYLFTNLLSFTFISHCTHTHTQRDQLKSHEEQVAKLESETAEHKQGTVPTKGLALQNYREKEAYLQYEVRYFFCMPTHEIVYAIKFFSHLNLQLKRYKTYVYLLSSHINSNPTDLINIIITSGNSTPTTPSDEDELRPLSSLTNQQGTNRYSYRAAIYRSEQDIG
jgi:hypothetical protein